MSEKLAYSVDELGEILGISRTTAYEVVCQEGFPAIRVSPRRIIVPKAGLEKWLEEKSKEGATK